MLFISNTFDPLLPNLLRNTYTCASFHTQPLI